MIEFTSNYLLIIPTHAHPQTLSFAIESACRQTISDVDIVVIGDGVKDETRTVVSSFLRKDKRISFLDRDKSSRHGEEYRNEVIRNSSAKFITYLGDDDLLFEDHLETMTEVIGQSDFANPLPVMINPDKSLTYLGTDLAIPESLGWHLDKETFRNSVSLTGVMHTRESYLKLPYGWRPAPTGRWSDHYMWEQYFQLENFSAKTSHIATTAKFSQSAREYMSDEQRSQEVKDFFGRLYSSDFREAWRETTLKAVIESAVQAHIENFNKENLIEHQNELINLQSSLINQNEELLSEIQTQLAQEQSRLSSIQNSKSWKLTQPLRKLRSNFH